MIWKRWGVDTGRPSLNHELFRINNESSTGVNVVDMAMQQYCIEMYLLKQITKLVAQEPLVSLRLQSEKLIFSGTTRLHGHRRLKASDDGVY